MATKKAVSKVNLKKAIAAIQANTIPDAPSDSNAYVRKNGRWELSDEQTGILPFDIIVLSPDELKPFPNGTIGFIEGLGGGFFKKDSSNDLGYVPVYTTRIDSIFDKYTMTRTDVVYRLGNQLYAVDAYLEDGALAPSYSYRLRRYPTDNDISDLTSDLTERVTAIERNYVGTNGYQSIEGGLTLTADYRPLVVRNLSSNPAIEFMGGQSSTTYGRLTFSMDSISYTNAYGSNYTLIHSGNINEYLGDIDVRLGDVDMSLQGYTEKYNGLFNEVYERLDALEAFMKRFTELSDSRTPDSEI